MFLFARNVDIRDANIRLNGACYRGPVGLTQDDGENFRISMGEEDGAQSILVYNQKSKKVSIETDISGQLAFRYVFLNNHLYISSHDIELAPFIPFVVDEISLKNLRTTGWSIGGHSLIQGIKVCPSGSVVSIEDEIKVEPILLRSSRSPDEDCINYLGSRLPLGEVVVELSAGFDSRASLAATIACKNIKDIKAFSEGPADCLDVTVARKICKTYGIAFEHRTTSSRRPEDVFDDWTKSSVLNNGHIEINVLASRGGGGRRGPPFAGMAAKYFAAIFIPTALLHAYFIYIRPKP